MDSHEATAILDEIADDCPASHSTCPLCGEALLVLNSLVRCSRCGLMLCEGCEGTAGS